MILKCAAEVAVAATVGATLRNLMGVVEGAEEGVAGAEVLEGVELGAEAAEGLEAADLVWGGLVLLL
jgi:hypothetical protein